ncbi:MAG: tetrahydrofolate dehydrogenase/cyclohydrolase catalytic domain-containing protein, partial [Bacteroidota bacterium]|nr:tetrahydrofolate dehydrogenase/cyclohydrolase catalytic domain-containing protein [Bacteroidota bacterium]
MKILDGKKTSLTIQQELAQMVKEKVGKGLKRPHLAAILVGDDGPSQTYVNAKVKACDRIGFKS